MPDDVPRQLALVREFVNSRDVEAGTDELSSAEELSRWLRARGLMGAQERSGDSELALALSLRESLRGVLRSQHGPSVDRAALDEVNRIAAGLPLRVRFDDGDSTLEPAGAGVQGALARLLADVAVAMTTGTWQRLKACSKDSCQWVFYDRSKNRSGRWCTMKVCGNRTKTRAYRERQRSERA